jgi:chitin deacetylase
MWDIEPDSYPDVAEESDRIVAHVRERAQPGSIILLHVMYPSRQTSQQAVRGIVETLRSDGYSFVTLSELLSED